MKLFVRLAVLLLAFCAVAHAAIAVVQVGSVGHFNGSSLTAQSVLSGVTAGNTIISCVNHEDFGSTAPAISVSDGVSYTADEAFQLSSAYDSGIYRSSSVTAGTHTVVATASSGTTGNSFGSVVAVEISGLAASPVDQAAVGHNIASTTPSVGPTSVLAQANELLIVCYVANGVTTGITWPPTGGPGTFTTIDNSLSTNDSASAQQIQTSGTSAVTVSAGTTPTRGWVMPLVTYKAAASGNNGAMMMRGIGANRPRKDHRPLLADNDDYFHQRLDGRLKEAE
jgi:hypothetical protein